MLDLNQGSSFTQEYAEIERLEKLVNELADALRAIHDYAVPDTHYRYCTPSKKAFAVAAKLLKRLGK